MEPIHVFLDTTMTFDDPFFKKNFNQQLLRLSKIYHFPIYMSRVVYEETRNKFIEHVKSRIGGLETALRDLENFYPVSLDTVSINCTVNDFQKQFDEFYSDLLVSNILQIIEYDNSLLPVLIERSIRGIKPFGPKKQEFRDAVTWLTYVNFVETNNLNNCFLITNNTTDFCDNKTRNTIHPELLKDSNKFSHFISSKDLIESEPLKPYIDSAEITEWLKTVEIDNIYVYGQLKEIFAGELLMTFINRVERCSGDFVRQSLSSDMDVSCDKTWIEEVAEEVKITIIKDQVVLSGDVFVHLDVELHHYDERGRGRHLGSDTVHAAATYTFTLDRATVHENSLELDDFEATKEADFEVLDSWYDDYE